MKRHSGSHSQRTRRSGPPKAAVIERAPLGARQAPFCYRDVRSAVDALPREQQEAILLYWLRGLDYGDIARELSLPLARIRSRITRAKTTLRATIGSRRLAD